MSEKGATDMSEEKNRTINRPIIIRGYVEEKKGRRSWIRIESPYPLKTVRHDETQNCYEYALESETFEASKVTLRDNEDQEVESYETEDDGKFSIQIDPKG